MKEELDERGRTQVHFAELMGITKAEVNQLIHEKKNVTPMLAYRVAAAFGTSVDVWLGLQNMHDMGKIEKDKK
ncbi:MAG: HigA family addiction module antidote protein, partial [Candidatus Peribacteria bacterium]|nr:HigA family addiction module antidote protein [Candidatus Peribacteria bacterium]